MKSRYRFLAFALIISALFPISLKAAPFDGQPKILLHVGPPVSSRSAACAAGQLTDCRDAVTAGDLMTSTGPCFVYVLAAPGDMCVVAGLEFGIDYENGLTHDISNHSGIDIWDWQVCATLEFPQPTPTWPAPGGGNLVTWDPVNHCQSGEVAVVGYFYVGAYSTDTLTITPRPVDGMAKLADCDLRETQPLGTSSLGSVIFSPGAAQAGCNPCDGPCPGTTTPPQGFAPCTPPPPPPPPPPPVGLPEAAILLHISSPTTKNACSAGLLDDPADAVVQADLSTSAGPFYFVYLLAAKREVYNIAGVQCGISYETNQPGDRSNGQGIDIFDWVLCGNMQFSQPAWPSPGSGNMITWIPGTNCQTGPTAVAGYFYLAAYSEDRLVVTTHPADGYAKVAECSAAETMLYERNLGVASFSEQAHILGCNPWTSSCAEAVPVQSTTWSAIKTQYRN